VLVDPVAVVLATLLVLPGVPARALLGTALAVGVVCRLADLHRERLVLTVLEDLPGLVLAAVSAVLVVAALDPAVAVRAGDLPRLAALGGAVFAVAVLARTAVYAATHLLRRSGALAHPVVVVGAGAVGRRLVLALATHREHGLDPVGIVDSAPPGTLRGLPVPLLGDVDDLADVVRRLGVRHVVFAFAAQPDRLTLAVVRACLADGLQVHVVPRFHEAVGRDRRLRAEVVGDVALVRLPRLAASRPTRAVRRVVDVVVALCGLVVLAPVLLVLAVAVRVENGPAVLFRQTRVGVAGEAFTVLRFRGSRPSSPSLDPASGSVDVTRRRGPVGRFVRRSGLDDLPQLVDVVRGDVSLDARDRRDPAITGPHRARRAPASRR
jgi:hypothetical protein